MASEIDWQQYEREITDQLRACYPSAQITSNAHLPGTRSKIQRQIDILIEEEIADLDFRLIVDAKFRGRKIDVGDVEAFLGLVRDVEAHTGIMVALEGYTDAAIKRAHHDDVDAILDVLNFADLTLFQGETAIPYAGPNGVSIAAPFGWVIDARQRGGAIAWLYQRGRTLQDAMGHHEFMYVNLWSKVGRDLNPEIVTLEALLKHQEVYMREQFADAQIEYLQSFKNGRTKSETAIRRMKTAQYATAEYTGFVDFKDCIMMCVLFTPDELERKNLWKLRFVLRDSFPVSVSYERPQT